MSQDGVGHTMYDNFAFEEGAPIAKNFDKYRLIRMKAVTGKRIFKQPFMQDSKFWNTLAKEILV